MFGDQELDDRPADVDARDIRPRDDVRAASHREGEARLVIPQDAIPCGRIGLLPYLSVIEVVVRLKSDPKRRANQDRQEDHANTTLVSSHQVVDRHDTAQDGD